MQKNCTLLNYIDMKWGSFRDTSVVRHVIVIKSFYSSAKLKQAVKLFLLIKHNGDASLDGKLCLVRMRAYYGIYMTHSSKPKKQ